MEKFNLIPEFFESIPNELLQLTYENGVSVNGSELKPEQVFKVPEVKWKNIEENSLYTLVMIDPDCPPEFREIIHWLVINIPGGDISKGEAIFSYVGSGPSEGSGLHRYIFALYKQPRKFGDVGLTQPSGDITQQIQARRKFALRKFVQKMQMEKNLIAINAYQAQWNEFVIEFRKRLGLK